MRALIASGAGRYADPWHPFSRTSPQLADIIADAGVETSVVEDVDTAMASLTGVDLLVVNAGDPWRPTGVVARPSDESIDGLAAALDRGIGVLAMHCAVSSLRDYPEWAVAIGGMWVPGVSFHPPLDSARITGSFLPDGTPVEDFTVEDERYCRLQRLGRSSVVAEAAGPDVFEPMAWVRRAGRSRIAVDVLGHDERSYDAPGHRRLIAQLIRWSLAER